MTTLHVSSLRETLANLIIMELQDLANDADLNLHAYVRKHHANSVALYPYFHEDCDPAEFRKLRKGDLEVLVDIASSLGFVIDLNWYRKGKL